jgi:hypothetical protein
MSVNEELDKVSEEEDAETPEEEKGSEAQEEQKKVEEKEEEKSFDWDSEENPFKMEFEKSEKRRKDLESWAYQLSQRQAELEKKLQPPVDNPEEEFQKFSQNPRKYVTERLVEGLSVISPQIEETKFYSTHPDWKKYEESMIDIFAEKPYLQTIPNKFDVVYDLAKAREYRKGMEEAQKDAYTLGKKTQQDKEKIKTKTELSTAGSTKLNVSTDEEWLQKINKAKNQKELDDLYEQMGNRGRDYNQPRTIIG